VKLLGRIFTKVIALDIELSAERHLARAHRRIFRIVDGLQLLELPFRIVVDHHPEGIQDCHTPGRAQIQVLAEAVLQQLDIDNAVAFCHADDLGEIADRFRGVAAAADARDGRHARVVPTADMFLGHQLQQLALAEQGIGEVEACKFDLLGVVNTQLVKKPVIKRPMVLKFKRADGMGDSLNRIGNTVGIVVHGIDAPGITGTMVIDLFDPVDRRVAHVKVGRSHIDFGPQHPAALRKFTRAHACEQIQIFRDTPVAIGAVLAGLGQRPPVFPDLIGT